MGHGARKWWKSESEGIGYHYPENLVQLENARGKGDSLKKKGGHDRSGSWVCSYYYFSSQ
jgi:hypothetical protein